MVSGDSTLNATNLPLGDQVGSISSTAGVAVNRRWALPSACIVQRSLCLEARTKTILCPFCEYDGERLLYLRLSVSRRRCLPVEVVVKIWARLPPAPRWE
jgi:hypothetical protein